MNCPKCSTECYRDGVDVGVGVTTGLTGVPVAAGAIDQYGGYHPPGSSMALAYRPAREPLEKMMMEGRQSMINWQRPETAPRDTSY
jgi:hypothetical protein